MLRQDTRNKDRNGAGSGDSTQFCKCINVLVWNDVCDMNALGDEYTILSLFELVFTHQDPNLIIIEQSTSSEFSTQMSIKCDKAFAGDCTVGTCWPSRVTDA